MIKAIAENKRILFFLGSWIVAGALSSVFGYLLSLFMFIGFKRNNWTNLLVLGLWFILIISDNGKGLNFTKSTKPIIMALTFVFVWIDKKSFSFKSTWYKYLIPFFVIAGIMWLRNPNQVQSLQKTISIMLLFLTIPSLVVNAYLNNGKEFLFQLIWFGWILLLICIVGYLINPGYFSYAHRFCGIFRNPNGLGVFIALYFFLFHTIKDILPMLFTKRDVFLVYLICTTAIILCGSRGALLAVIIFLAFNQFYKISPYLGFLIMVLTISLANYALSQLPIIITGLGLEDFFRLETLEDGSGRLVAWEFAIERIKESPFLGRGIGYTDYVFHENYIELNLLGHQGNAHNSYLTYWLDTGIFGLASLLIGLLIVFIKSSFNSRVALPICYAFLFMINVESWLIASLNPFTIILVMILTLLYHKKDILLNEEKKAALALS